MHRLVAVTIGLALAACTLYRDHNGGDPDASIDAPLPIDGQPPLPCQQEPPHPLCGESCGNNTIDDCWILDPIGPACPDYLHSREQCDGTDGPTCAGIGYYGAGSACGACFVTGTGCEACPPGATACATLDFFGFQFGSIATSGTYTAFVATDAVLIVNGTTEVGRFPFMLGSDIVAVPGGWLVSQVKPDTLVPLAPDGTFGTPRSAPSAYVTMAYAADRVLVVFWEDTMLRAYVADTSGVEVVPAFDLFISDRRPTVISDGTGFFVAADGRLAHVTTAGAVTVNTDYPLEAPDSGIPPGVTWNGTSGWHIVQTAWPNGDQITLQRFDATGAHIGSPIAITLAADPFTFLADGDGLLAVRVPPSGSGASPVSLVHIASDGTIGAAVEVGAGQRAYHAARQGSEVRVVWTRPGHLQIAQVTP